MKKDRPFSQCTKCTAVDGTINERCRNSYNGKRCKGINRSMIAVGDWETCSDCLAEGCMKCRNVGWFNKRKNI